MLLWRVACRVGEMAYSVVPLQLLEIATPQLDSSVALDHSFELR